MLAGWWPKPVLKIPREGTLSRLEPHIICKHASFACIQFRTNLYITLNATNEKRMERIEKRLIIILNFVLASKAISQRDSHGEKDIDESTRKENL